MRVELFAHNRWPGRYRAALAFENQRAIPGLSAAESRRSLGAARDEGFGARFKQVCVVRTGRGRQRMVLVGLGKRQDFEPDRVRSAVAQAVKRLGEMNGDEIGLHVPDNKPVQFVRAAIEGAGLGSYRYTEHRKTQANDPKPMALLGLVLPRGRAKTRTLERAAAEALVVSDAVCYTRDLVNEPPSQKVPEMMAELAMWLAKRGRIEVEVLHRDELVKRGMNGILRVGAGSPEAPCLVHFTYRPKRRSRKSVVVVGKGVTFDSGGLSLKPSASMEGMKQDMAGAATVFGLFRLLGDLDVGVTVHGLAPLAENLPGDGAQKPGDVIRHFNGKTVEVLNTDAEGRLILADALAYGSTLKPSVMLDLATLTGAAVVAVGDEYTAVMGTDQGAIDRIIALGRDQGEFFWQLPLPERYRSHIDSKVADIKNMGKPRIAGTIIAGLFLREFVDSKVPWVHLDIAGPAYTKDAWDYAPVGATGVPLRTLFAFIRGF